MDEQSRAQVDLIREAFHYQSRFTGRTIVFKIDFPIMLDSHFPFLMRDLALLANIGIRVVVVPGAKERIDAVLKEYGIVSEYRDALRVTSADAIPFVKMAAFDTAARFMTGFAAAGVGAVIGNYVRARGLGILDGVDFQHSGSVERIDVDGLHRLLSLGMIPILPCIGWSAAGKPYNVPSDEIAAALCAALGAAKFFIVSTNAGLKAQGHRLPASIRTDSEGRVARLTPAEASEIMALNSKTKNSGEGDAAIGNLALALTVCRAGTERVHLVDGREEGAVLRELFSNLGSGVMVYADEYEAIRPMAAEDVPEVARLMEPLMSSGILIQRSSDEILEKRDDFVVFNVDGTVHACGALHDWGDGVAELAALAVDPAYAELGLGRRVAHYLIDRARERGYTRVIALTTRAQDWFELLGFKSVSSHSLPERKRRLYDEKRRSQVFALELGENLR